MRLLFDTNIILDVLLNRKPWVIEAKALWQAVDEQLMTGYISASSLTDIFYIARRAKDYDTAIEAISVCLTAFEICPVDRPCLEYALALPDKDFEDNLQIACAKLAQLDGIVTRNPNDFGKSPVTVLTPTEAINEISSSP
ncbi:MAG: PIN domain-containing protein [Anaerolineae bacterium]|nr:PIN domain-containing protein [Anaerolineae bacterium]